MSQYPNNYVLVCFRMVKQIARFVLIGVILSLDCQADPGPANQVIVFRDLPANSKRHTPAHFVIRSTFKVRQVPKVYKHALILYSKENKYM